MPRLASGCRNLGIEESWVGYFGHRSARLPGVVSCFQHCIMFSLVHVRRDSLQPLETGGAPGLSQSAGRVVLPHLSTEGSGFRLRPPAVPGLMLR